MLSIYVYQKFTLKKNGDSVSGIMGWNISACIFYL